MCKCTNFTFVFKIIFSIMKKFFLSIFSLVFPLIVSAQEITEYQCDDTSSFFSRYELLIQQNEQFDYHKTQQIPRVHTSVSVGVGVGAGNYEYVNPKVDIEATKKLSFSVGMGFMYSNFRVGSVSATETPTYQNLRAMSNFYSVQAAYKASEKLLVTSSLIYGQNNILNSSNRAKSNFDSYIATFGATYQITPAFSVGFEVSQYHNVSPFYMPYSRF